MSRRNLLDHESQLDTALPLKKKVLFALVYVAAVIIVVFVTKTLFDIAFSRIDRSW